MNASPLTLPNCVSENVSLAPYSYYKIGGPARYLARPKSQDDLSAVSDYLKLSGVPFFILGAGSNLLFNDEGFSGMVIQSNALDRTLALQNEARILVGTSCTVAQILRFASENGIGGLDFMIGIPGSMGGLVTMNAGTKWGELKDHLLTLTTYHLKTGTIENWIPDQFRFAYRSNEFLTPYHFVLNGLLQGRLGEPAQIKAHIQTLLAQRKGSQPLDKPSCGSVFKNPPGQQAWKLIDDAGLHGTTVGGAQISPVHTNFIVNNGGAKQSDVLELIHLAKDSVKKRFGILLEEEVKIVPYEGKISCLEN